jgi:hypothetical protein
VDAAPAAAQSSSWTLQRPAPSGLQKSSRAAAQDLIRHPLLVVGSTRERNALAVGSSCTHPHPLLAAGRRSSKLAAGRWAYEQAAGRRCRRAASWAAGRVVDEWIAAAGGAK